MYKYKLWNIILRKEFFWWIIYNLDIKNYIQINKDAYLILTLLKNPLTINELTNKLKEKWFEIDNEKLKDFLWIFFKNKTIVKDDKNSNYMIFFDDIKFDDMKHDRLNAPTNLSIYITKRCPKSCIHCVTRANPNAPHNDELTKEEWFEVLEKIRKAGVTTIVFSWWEPLIKEWIFEILEEADKLNLSIVLLSDYDDITEDMIERIKKLKNLEDFQCSLDWATKETHDWMRWKWSFEKAMRRMKMLTRSWIKYTVSTVIHKKNIGELDKIVDLVKNIWATYHYISPLSPYGRGAYMDNFLLSDDELKFLWQKYLKYVYDGIIKTRNAFWVNNINKVNDKNFHPFKDSLTLTSNWFYNFSIKWQWDCYLDSKFWSKEFLNLWNIKNKDLLTIWNNPILDKIRSPYEKKWSIYIKEEEVRKII